MKRNVLKRVVMYLLLTMTIMSVCIFVSCAGLSEYKRRVAGINITMDSFAGIPAGVYNGEYDAVLVSAKVQVTVEPAGIVQDIQFEHKHDRGITAEVVVPRVIEQQTLLVDTVSGATSSSKVILKAIQNALESAK